MTLNGSHNGNKIHVECHAAFSPGNVGPEIKVPFAVRWLLSVVYVICLSTCCLHFRAHFALLQLSLMLQLNSAKSVWHLLFMLTHSHSHSHTVTQSHSHPVTLPHSSARGLSRTGPGFTAERVGGMDRLAMSFSCGFYSNFIWKRRFWWNVYLRYGSSSQSPNLLSSPNSIESSLIVYIRHFYGFTLYIPDRKIYIYDIYIYIKGLLAV